MLSQASIELSRRLPSIVHISTLETFISEFIFKFKLICIFFPSAALILLTNIEFMAILSVYIFLSNLVILLSISFIYEITSSLVLTCNKPDIILI